MTVQKGYNIIGGVYPSYFLSLLYTCEHIPCPVGLIHAQNLFPIPIPFTKSSTQMMTMMLHSFQNCRRVYPNLTSSY